MTERIFILQAESDNTLGRNVPAPYPPHLHQLPAVRAPHQHSSALLQSLGMQPLQLGFLQAGNWRVAACKALIFRALHAWSGSRSTRSAARPRAGLVNAKTWHGAARTHGQRPPAEGGLAGQGFCCTAMASPGRGRQGGTHLEVCRLVIMRLPADHRQPLKVAAPRVHHLGRAWSESSAVGRAAAGGAAARRYRRRHLASAVEGWCGQRAALQSRRVAHQL